MARTSRTESGEKKPSQMGMVRTALEEIGDVKPLEMQAHIKTKFGVELPPNIISNYKSQIKRKNGTAGPGRGRRAGALQDLDTIRTVRGLVAKFGADQVKQLVDALA